MKKPNKFNRLTTGRGYKLMKCGKGLSIYKLIQNGCTLRRSFDMICESYDAELGELIFEYYARRFKRRGGILETENVSDPIQTEEMDLGGESFKSLYVPMIEDKFIINKMSRL